MAKGEGGASGGKTAAIIAAVGTLLVGVAAVLGVFKPDGDSAGGGNKAEAGTEQQKPNGTPPPVITQEHPGQLPPGQGGDSPVQTPSKSPIQMPSAAPERAARVAGGDVRLRIAPVDKPGSGPALTPGEALTVSESQPGWYSVTTVTGRKGFLRADEVVLD